MAKHSDGSDGFEARLAEGDSILTRVAGLVQMTKVLTDALEQVGVNGDALSRRVAREALDRAKVICEERL